MECNKDEALRAKLIADSKLEKKDFTGAKKFAVKAKSLYPYLDGITQMLATIDVCVSGENKIGGVADWYGVLGIKPSDDDETIRKQYRRMALLLHPDKNKSAGADGAFKLISEAWSVLSDKAKRAVYDQCRVSKGSQSKVKMHASGPSAPSPGGNGIFNFTGRATSVPKTQKKSPNAPVPPTPPSNRRTDSFWTICHRCKMHYEYQRQYLNQNLLCPTCREVFLAAETAPPYYFGGPSNQVPRQRQQTSSERTRKQDAPVSQKSEPGQASSNSFRYPHHQQGRPSGTTGIGTADPSVVEKAANGMEQAHGKLKRVSTESQTSLESEGSLKKRKVDNGTTCGMDHHTAQGNGSYGTASGSAPGPRIHGFSGTFLTSNSIRDLTPAESRNMLIKKARKVILNKLSKMQSESTAKARKKENKTKQSNCEGSVANAKERNQNGYNDSPATKVAEQPDKDRSNHSVGDASEEEESHIAATMSVPDPEFHDFDQDRSESSFGDNQVWAAYDDDDGMPRFYALINKVISRKPFKLRISWLNSKTNSEFSTIDWVGSGFYKTCGEFRVGKYETFKLMNSFSHKVNWSKGPRGSVLLFPKKGDVWALYRNWSPDWNEHTLDEVIHKYDMVLVLDEYNEERGISVAPLVKVAGFKAIFSPNMDAEAMKRIPRAEMFRFSHQVPYLILTGQEAKNAPKGFLELDPAATPLELLQVITGNNGISMDSNKSTAAEEMLQSVPSRGLDDNADGAKAAHVLDAS